MHARIAAHKQQRGGNWITHEVLLDLPEALKSADGPGRTLLVDCLTLWLSNLILAKADWCQMTNQLLATLQARRANVVLVSNEVGLGIVPDNALAREFRDAQGSLNQQVAQIADKVVFVAAGLPLTLKG
jgi:adenosylcobinamide kinase/adenosylcobinamide-phosphate guanylyltransferase